MNTILKDIAESEGEIKYINRREKRIHALFNDYCLIETITKDTEYYVSFIDKWESGIYVAFKGVKK